LSPTEKESPVSPSLSETDGGVGDFRTRFTARAVLAVGAITGAEAMAGAGAAAAWAAAAALRAARADMAGGIPQCGSGVNGANDVESRVGALTKCSSVLKFQRPQRS
jgi:hypothetical protein